MSDLASKGLLLACVVLAYELGFLRGRGGKARWRTPRERLAEVFCPALAADGERFPYAVPTRGWLHDRARCSACGQALPAESHPPNPDDAAIVRLVRERDAADDGTRHTLDEVLAEHGIERGSLQV
jgi:hypothetical protein